MFVLCNGALYFKGTNGEFYPVSKERGRLLVSDTPTEMELSPSAIFTPDEIKRKTHASSIVFGKPEKPKKESKPTVGRPATRAKKNDDEEVEEKVEEAEEVVEAE